MNLTDSRICLQQTWGSSTRSSTRLGPNVPPIQEVGAIRAIRLLQVSTTEFTADVFISTAGWWTGRAASLLSVHLYLINRRMCFHTLFYHVSFPHQVFSHWKIWIWIFSFCVLREVRKVLVTWELILWDGQHVLLTLQNFGAAYNVNQPRSESSVFSYSATLLYYSCCNLFAKFMPPVEMHNPSLWT